MTEVLVPRMDISPENTVSPEEMVLVGAKAVADTLQQPMPGVADEFVIAPEKFSQLAQQPGWFERDGALVDSKKPSIFITDSYNGTPHAELLQRGQRIGKGLVKASLPDIYTVMQSRGDTPETADIRQRLLDPEQTLLPTESLPREQAMANYFMEMIPGAEDDPQHEAALKMATNALHTLFTLYGDPQIGRVNQIVGSLEKPEYGVRAFYHNAFEVVQDVEDLMAHLDTIGASTADKLDALVADLYADIAYGNGRKSDNKKSFDELQSANLLYAHARQCNYPIKRAKRLRHIVLSTRYNEATRDQPGRTDKDPAARAVTAEDLQLLARPGAVKASQEIAAENMMSRRKSNERVLGRLLRREGIIPYTIEETTELIREFRDAPVSSEYGATLRDVYAHEMLGSADFHEDYRPPEGWTRDNLPQRIKNAKDIRLHVKHFQQTGKMVTQ